MGCLTILWFLRVAHLQKAWWEKMHQIRDYNTNVKEKTVKTIKKYIKNKENQWGKNISGWGWVLK